MKSQREIRKHRDDVRAAQSLGLLQTEDGRLIARVLEETLSWTLGEAPQYDRVVEQTSADVARARAGVS